MDLLAYGLFIKLCQSSALLILLFNNIIFDKFDKHYLSVTRTILSNMTAQTSFKIICYRNIGMAINV